MNKPIRLVVLFVVVALAVYFGLRSVDLGAFIMRLHGR